MKWILLLRSLFYKTGIDIFTDGSHKGKWGSWAYVIVCKDKVIHESCGRKLKTNSHRMEFEAAIEALSFLKESSKINLHSDSRVLIKALTEKALRPAANADQIQKLHELKSRHEITWKWVKAHSGVRHNERCDQLCREARSGS